MSEHDSTSRPVEVYRFEIEGYAPMLYTSDEHDVTCEGDLYEAMPGLSRGDLIIATAGEAAAFTVRVPATSTLAQRVGMFTTPARVVMKFRRYQRADLSMPTIRLDAKMESASVKNRECILKFPDVFTGGLSGLLPKNRIQTQCNWTLGDSNCGVDLAAFQANVDDISEVVQFARVVPGQYMIQASWADGVDPYDPFRWVGGIITGTFGDITERRTIYKIAFINGDARRFELRARIELSRSFDNIPVDQGTFTIRPGCDNSWARCVELENTQRFGGFIDVPTERENPFRVRLNAQRKRP